MKPSAWLSLGIIIILAGCQTAQPLSSFPSEREKLTQSINDWFPLAKEQETEFSVSEEFLLYKSLAYLTQEIQKNIHFILQKRPKDALLSTSQVISLLPPQHADKVSILPFQTQDIQNKLSFSKEQIITISDIYETFQVLMATEVQELPLKETLNYYKKMHLIFEKAAQQSLQDLEKTSPIKSNLK